MTFSRGVPSPDYIYLGANFTDAVGGRSYHARVCVEAFTE
jgi:hypothetical protein